MTTSLVEMLLSTQYMDTLTKARDAHEWAQICRELRKFTGISQIRMAVCMGVSPAALNRLRAREKKIPRPQTRQRIEAAYARLKGAPTRPLKRHRFPFADEMIPAHCGAPTQFLYARYSHARRIPVWNFQCRKCSARLRRDKKGNDVPLILSGNFKQLPFDRPRCCDHNLNIWRPKSRDPRFPRKDVYFLWCSTAAMPDERT